MHNNLKTQWEIESNYYHLLFNESTTTVISLHTFLNEYMNTFILTYSRNTVRETEGYKRTGQYVILFSIVHIHIHIVLSTK